MPYLTPDESAIVYAQVHEAAVAENNRAQLLEEPYALYRPRLFIDGDHWCALLGENLQEGVAGFGKSPATAARAFNKAWHEELP